MNATLWRAAALAGGLAAFPLAGCAEAQGSLAARVAAAPDGEVWMHFTSRPDVCGWDENSVSRNGSHRSGVTIVSDDGVFTGTSNRECIEGPVYVSLRREGGDIEKIRLRVGRPWSTEGRGRVTDLGRVGVREATSYLLGLAERETGRVGEEAIFPATLADSVTLWPELLRIARREAVPERTRRSAVFWLSQQAGEAVTRGISELVNDDPDQEIRKQAVFALSQRPRDESVPALIEVARSHRDPEIRKTALFWLGQSKDPRALALFEEILGGP